VSPLRILYDFEAFSDQSYGGISRYILEVANRIEASGDAVVHLAAGWHRNQYLKTEKPEWASGRFFPAWPKTGEIRRRLNALLTRRAIRRFRPDIVHRTYHRHAAEYPGSHSMVATIHDLTYFLYPDSFPYGEVVRENLHKVARTSDHLLCDSENTRKDAMRILELDPTKSDVVHLGVNMPEASTGSSPIDGAFLLYVGQRQGYKNFGFLTKTLADHRLLDSQNLVVFGGGRFTDAEQDELDSLGIQDRIIHMSGDDALLSRCYTHALALIYPSLYEGFGLPVLEAMAHGCPVLCSNVSSLPEVGGDAASFFSPEGPIGLADAVHKLVSDPTLRQVMRAKGLEHVQRFSWAKCADETMRVYRSLIDSR